MPCCFPALPNLQLKNEIVGIFSWRKRHLGVTGCMTRITEIKINGSPSQPTLSSVTLWPIRKRSSAMKRLMQRFLWMVFLSLCRPRKKQNVKMHMAKQTSETTMPTRVMTVSSSLCSLPGPWRTTGWRERTYREERRIKWFAKAMRDHVCHNHLF